MFKCDTCNLHVPASEAVAHSKACVECIDLTVRVRATQRAPLYAAQRRRPYGPLRSSSGGGPTAMLHAMFRSNKRVSNALPEQASPPAKAARAVSAGSPHAVRRVLAPEAGSSAAVALVVSDSPPRRALALAASPPRVALATLQESRHGAGAASFKPKAELFSPPPPQLADDDEELPLAPWSRPHAPRPAAPPQAPASDRKVAATLWPEDDDDGASISADSDGEDECTDESAAAAEAALKNFGHLDDQPLDPALLVDVRTRLKPHQLIFCRWARDRPAVILADDMGLGKTLSSFALCRARMPPPDWDGFGTLIVVPKSLMSQWKHEFGKHLAGSHGGIYLFYGPKKITDPARLRRFEFVVTTYETVRNAAATPRATSNDADELFSLSDSPLARLCWWRIILDEAHVARNRSTRLCLALCDLRAERRVALSGTPIQNGLADLYSLLRWLKIPGPLKLDAPDSRSGEQLAFRVWKTRVSKPLTSAKRPQARTVAFGLLNSVLSGVLIRRVKKDQIRGAPLIVLPMLTYDDQTVSFTADEKALYETLFSDAVACFNRHLRQGDILKNYIFILVKLLRLRQCCAHPALVVERRDVCGACHKPLGNGGSGKLSIAPCGHKFCSECIEACVEGRRPPSLVASGRGRGRGRGRFAGGRGGSERKPVAAFDSDDELELVAGAAAGRKGCKCPLADCDEWLTRDDLAPVDADSGEDVAISRPLGAAAGGHEQSSKIALLLKGLKALPKGAKSLIFSQWTSLLSILEPFLTDAGIVSQRLDGSMSMEDRAAAVERFTTSDDCSVFMLSLKAGGVGLHLVAATHVWLMDPWWNPMVEEQAFQRCHRLGQTRPVTIHRLYIQETVEQAVVSLQERKRCLAESTLDADIGRLNKLSVEDLKLLFTRPPPAAAAAGGAAGGGAA